MKTTGLKAMIIVLAAMWMAGQAYAGWGGGRQGGGWYGPRPRQGIQSDTDEQGPWMGRGPGRGGPNAGPWQGDPVRGRSGPEALGPRGGWQGMGPSWGRGYNGSRGPGARLDRGGRFGRGYQGCYGCPYCLGWARRPVIQGRPMRGNWEQGLRGGRAERGFRRSADLPGRGAWNGPRRGLQGRNFGPQRPGSINENQGQSFEPGRGGRGFWRGDASGPQGQGVDRPNRDKWPFLGPRGGRGREDRPGLRRGPDRSVERPVEKDADTPKEIPPAIDGSKEDAPTGEGV